MYWSDTLLMKRKDNILHQLKANRRLSVATFWLEVGSRAISFFCAMIFMVIILSATVQATVQELNRICIYAAVGLGVLWSIPFIRLTRMRLRDAGFSPKAYLWLLLPVLGLIVFAGLMCAKGKPQSPESAIEVL